MVYGEKGKGCFAREPPLRGGLQKLRALCEEPHSVFSSSNPLSGGGGVSSESDRARIPQLPLKVKGKCLPWSPSRFHLMSLSLVFRGIIAQSQLTNLCFEANILFSSRLECGLF
jgi:hypothetical protein